MISTPSGLEIAIIAVIALLVVGPKGLPKLGKSVGKAMRDFKREANELKNAIDIEVEEDDRLEKQKQLKEKRAKAQAAAKKKAENVVEAEKTEKPAE